MARKTMAFYSASPIVIEADEKLRVEIGSNYVVCSIVAPQKLLSFEFFELDNDINDWSDIFFEIKHNSQILDKNTGTVDIVYN
ncbi:MAG: hypothetical protein IBJ16_10990, partial [Chitinophagaceae bacterium]|nr:hypothetical protein [Chitinophagaceae bacterium]